MNTQEIFVPGRLCIFGEHSDWASEYISENPDIKEGHTIVACIDKGIYAKVKKYPEKFILKEKENILQVDLNESRIKSVIKSDSYYAYAATVALHMMKNYKVDGVYIDITRNDLPQKKGLSSSASICVLVCRAFNELYELNLSQDDEMEIAYLCERKALSKCGKMDQIVALNSGVFCMNFKNGKANYDKIKIGKDLYFVFADLKSVKNTPRILEDLHRAYPFPKNKKEEDLVKYLGDYNEEIVSEAIGLFEKGDSKAIGKLMCKAQKLFDKYVAPMSKEELKAPKLHLVLNDSYVNKHSLGGKGVGSQGDGAVQFIVENEKMQKELIDYLNNKLGLEAYPFKINENTSVSKVKKAIIPLAGYGTRMYPFTNSIPKSFISIVKDNQFKPVFEILVEELVGAGIETVGLVINKSQKDLYDKFFDKLEDKSLIKHVEYYYQEEQLGLGDAILCAKKLLDNEPFLLVLGDQFYVSHEGKSCTKQLLDAYDKLEKNLISVFKVELSEVEKYGVFFGKEIINNTYKITKILEKPTVSLAKKNNQFKKDDYYIAFGEYILDQKIIDKLDNYKSEHKGEIIPFTEFLEETYDDLYSFITNGVMYDIGNVNAYVKTVKELYK